MADHELVDENERDRFAPVMDRDRDGVDDRDQRHDRDGDGVDDRHETTTARHDRDGDGVDDRREAVTGRHDGDTATRPPARSTTTTSAAADEAAEHERPARFDRDEATEADRRDAPTRY